MKSKKRIPKTPPEIEWLLPEGEIYQPGTYGGILVVELEKAPTAIPVSSHGPVRILSVLGRTRVKWNIKELSALTRRLARDREHSASSWKAHLEVFFRASPILWGLYLLLRGDGGFSAPAGNFRIPGISSAPKMAVGVLRDFERALLGIRTRNPVQPKRRQHGDALRKFVIGHYKFLLNRDAWRPISDLARKIYRIAEDAPHLKRTPSTKRIEAIIREYKKNRRTTNSGRPGRRSSRPLRK